MSNTESIPGRASATRTIFGAAATWSLAALLSLSALVPTLGRAQGALREGGKVDAVVAIVGRNPIFKSTIDGQVQLYLLQSGKFDLNADSLMSLRRQILQNEIDQKVLIARAEQDSIIVSESEVDQRMEEQIKLYINRFGSEAAVERQFGRSVAELKASPDLRDRAREGMLVERFRQTRFTPPTAISRREVEEFYTTYRDSLPMVGAQVELASIVKLVKADGNQKERARGLASSLVDSLARGADFGVLAGRYSQHPSASNGGLLGDFFPRGTFIPVFEEAAFKLKAGEVSPVIETEQGFHIIKMIERRGEEIKIAQILIKPMAASTEASEQVKNELLKLREEALAGEDFGKLARQHSEDFETRNQGGYLGKIRLEELSPEQSEVLDSLKIGGITKPLHIAYSRTVTGFQIVKLLSRVAPHKPAMESDYRELEATALQLKQSIAFQKFIADSRGAVYTDVRDLAQFY